MFWEKKKSTKNKKRKQAMKIICIRLSYLETQSNQGYNW